MAELRERKRRDDKPFAVMVADLGRRAPLAVIDGSRGAARLVRGADRAAAARRTRLAAVAPRRAGQPLLGVMLPYTPLHHLLLGLPGDAGPRCSC